MGRRINIRPTTSVYATYKNIKYDPWTAIAEFVDNSTQSYYDHKSELCSISGWDGLNVEIIYGKDESGIDRLVIRDNAFGMNFKDFFAEFSPILEDFEDALQNNDTVMLGDLSEYEICPRLKDISKALKAM